jgi:DNA-binding winged helix-turn-helix (wHTH) protein
MKRIPISSSNKWAGAEKVKPDHSPPATIYRFGPFELDVGRYELRRGDIRLRLARAPLDLLALLVERRDTLLNREQIAARLWPSPDMVDVDQGINTAIRRIREVLADDPAKPRYIETVVGKGYRFIAEVSELRPESTVVVLPERPNAPDGSDEPKPPKKDTGSTVPAEPLKQKSPADEAKPKWRDKRFILAAAAVLFVLVVAYVGWRLHEPRTINYAATLTQVTANDSEQRVTAAAISPDGRWVAYADIKGISLHVLQSEETPALKGPEDFRADRIAWFPDQTKILVSGFNTRIARPQIWTVFITRDDPHLFRNNALNGIPSPDGSKIMFTINKDTELWIAGAAGEGSHPLIVDRTGRGVRGYVLVQRWKTNFVSAKTKWLGQ